MIERLNFPADKMAQTWCYKLCCGSAGQSKDKASGPLLFQGATLLITIGYMQLSRNYGYLTTFQ